MSSDTDIGEKWNSFFIDKDLVSWVIDSLSVPSRAHSNLQQVTWNYVSSIGAGRASLLKTDHALIFYYLVIDFQLGGCPPGIKKIYPPHFSTHTD
jgi:hypothetical protein